MKVPMVGEKTADKAVGRTRGGLNTKIHAVVDGLGNPVKFLLSAGNDNDCVHAVELLEKGIGNRVVVTKDGKVTDYDILEALSMKKSVDMNLLKIAQDIAL